MKRVEVVQQLRLASKSLGTVKLADTPTRFHVENMQEGHFIVVPEVSSERQRYVPMGFMDDSVLCSNKIRLKPDALLFHFGILTANVYMAWMRAACRRMKSDYDYSIKIVYNNSPWPTSTDKQKAMIEQTVQAILDAHALYLDTSLADLYTETTMPAEPRKAHQQNDKAVMQAYCFSVKDMTESKCVAELMKLDQELAKAE